MNGGGGGYKKRFSRCDFPKSLKSPSVILNTLLLFPLVLHIQHNYEIQTQTTLIHSFWKCDLTLWCQTACDDTQSGTQDFFWFYIR